MPQFAPESVISYLKKCKLTQAKEQKKSAVVSSISQVLAKHNKKFTCDCLTRMPVANTVGWNEVSSNFVDMYDCTFGTKYVWSTKARLSLLKLSISEPGASINKLFYILHDELIKEVSNAIIIFILIIIIIIIIMIYNTTNNKL